MTPWQAFIVGYERGIQTGYDAGYADGVDVLRDAVGMLASYQISRHPTHAELERRRAARKPLDTRTPEEVIDQAYASWGMARAEGAAA